jgi:hypothetical protein
MARGVTATSAALRTVPHVGAQVSQSAAIPVNVAIGASGATGAWVPLIATTGADAHWIALRWNTTSASTVAAAMLGDLAIGAAAAEVAIASSMAMGGVAATTPFNHVMLPIFVPSGSRLAIRLSAAGAHAETATVVATLYGASPLTPHNRSPRLLVPIGANAAAFTGTCQMTGANTYTQITAATTEPFQGLVFTNCGNDSATTAVEQTVTLGVGASGAEVDLAVDTHLTGTTEGIVPRTGFHTILRPIPLGARLAAKSNGAATNTWTAIPLGIPYT